MHCVEEFAKFVLSAQKIHTRKMIDSLVALLLGKAVRVPLSRGVHPEDVEVVVVGIARQAVCYVGCAATGLLIQYYLAVHRRKHISCRNKHIELILGNFFDNGIPAHADIEHKLLWLELDNLDFLLGFLRFIHDFFFVVGDDGLAEFVDEKV